MMDNSNPKPWRFSTAGNSWKSESKRKELNNLMIGADDVVSPPPGQTVDILRRSVRTNPTNICVDVSKTSVDDSKSSLDEFKSGVNFKSSVDDSESSLEESSSVEVQHNAVLQTKIKTNNENIKESEEFHKRNISLISFLTDSNGNLMSANTIVREVFGLETEKYTTHPCNISVPDNETVNTNDEVFDLIEPARRKSYKKHKHLLRKSQFPTKSVLNSSSPAPSCLPLHAACLGCDRKCQVEPVGNLLPCCTRCQARQSKQFKVEEKYSRKRLHEAGVGAEDSGRKAGILTQEHRGQTTSNQDAKSDKSSPVTISAIDKPTLVLDKYLTTSLIEECIITSGGGQDNGKVISSDKSERVDVLDRGLEVVNTQGGNHQCVNILNESEEGEDMVDLGDMLSMDEKILSHPDDDSIHTNMKLITVESDEMIHSDVTYEVSAPTSDDIFGQIVKDRTLYMSEENERRLNSSLTVNNMIKQLTQEIVSDHYSNLTAPRNPSVLFSEPSSLTPLLSPFSLPIRSKQTPLIQKVGVQTRQGYVVCSPHLGSVSSIPATHTRPINSSETNNANTDSQPVSASSQVRPKRSSSSKLQCFSCGQPSLLTGQVVCCHSCLAAQQQLLRRRRRSGQ